MSTFADFVSTKTTEMSTFADFVSTWPRTDDWHVARPVPSCYEDGYINEEEYVKATIFVNLEVKVKTSRALAETVRKLDLTKCERAYLEAAIVSIDRLKNKLLIQRLINEAQEDYEEDEEDEGEDEGEDDDETKMPTFADFLVAWPHDDLV